MYFYLLKRKSRLELTITTRDSFQKSAFQTEAIGESRAHDILTLVSELWRQMGQLTGHCLPSAISSHVHVYPAKALDE
jgi:hypothetical protein